MSKRQFILKYMEKSKNNISQREAANDVNILFYTLENVLITQGKVSFFKKGTFKLIERKEKTVGNIVKKGSIRKIPAEKTVKFKASPCLNKLFN